MTAPLLASRGLVLAAKRRHAYVDGVRPVFTASRYERSRERRRRERLSLACFSRPETTICKEGGL